MKMKAVLAQFLRICLLALSSLLIGCGPHDPSEATERSVSCSDPWIEGDSTDQQGFDC